MPRIFFCRSISNPFITLITTISAITPTPTPPTESAVIISVGVCSFCFQAFIAVAALSGSARPSSRIRVRSTACSAARMIAKISSGGMIPSRSTPSAPSSSRGRKIETWRRATKSSKPVRRSTRPEPVSTKPVMIPSTSISTRPTNTSQYPSSGRPSRFAR